MNLDERVKQLGPAQLTILVLLRVVIGWHFLYEGASKLLNPDWTSAPFLAESKWLFAGTFHHIAQTPWLLGLVDGLNAWGLTLIGLGLILGTFTRFAAVAGASLLALYYIANPPFIGFQSGMPTEGNYLWIDKNMIELMSLGVVALLPTGGIAGLDVYLKRWFQRAATAFARPEPVSSTPRPHELLAKGSVERRQLMKALATTPIMGGFVFAVMKKRGWESYEETHLLASGSTDAVSSATVKTFQFSSLKDLTEEMTYGQIGDLKLSRMFLGGNLIGGWAHSRDLIYVSKLVKSYHTDEKVFDTLRIAEMCGINTILTNPALARVINAYWRKRDGKIQFISDCAYGQDVMTGIRMSIDGGAHACYVQGGISDKLYEEGKIDEIGRAVDFIRQNNLPAGIGAHKLATVQACVEAGLKPDFWVKTIHHCNYWSAQIEEEHDNIWCTNPDETIQYMAEREEPWIGFKILAAGAIEPEVGFRYALEAGADFICVGMYDFQIVDDVNLACRIMAEDLNRNRPWRA